VDPEPCVHGDELRANGPHEQPEVSRTTRTTPRGAPRTSAPRPERSECRAFTWTDPSSDAEGGEDSGATSGPCPAGAAVAQSSPRRSSHRFTRQAAKATRAPLNLSDNHTEYRPKGHFFLIFARNARRIQPLRRGGWGHTSAEREHSRARTIARLDVPRARHRALAVPEGE
jgi:hypothetical protein